MSGRSTTIGRSRPFTKGKDGVVRWEVDGVKFRYEPVWMGESRTGRPYGYKLYAMVDGVETPAVFVNDSRDAGFWAEGFVEGRKR